MSVKGPSSNLFIRPVRPDELSALRDIAESTFRQTFESANHPEDTALYVAKAFTLETVKSEYERSGSSFFFALLDGVCVGYLKLNEGAAQTDPRLENALEIERIYLDQSSRGSGIGSALIEFSEDLARRHDHDWIWLGVWDQNFSAIRFYERHGYTQFDTHGFLYGSAEQIDLMMKKPLSA